MNLKNWSGIALVMGVDWGDSGKGRLIDDLSSRADVIARFNGGANTGHTVKNQHGSFALHIVPSGIFNSKALNLVGRNVAVDLESLKEELKQLHKAKVSYKNLVIDPQCSLVMPWHKLRDGLREKLRAAGQKVGTTGKGIGPVYADRTERVGLLVKNLIDSDFKQKLYDEVKIQNQFYSLNLNSQDIFKKYSAFAKMIKPHVLNTNQIIKDAQKAVKNILFEGAQGYFLDIDAGTYPFVTSSNPGIVGVWRSYDIHPSAIENVIAITKAYTTRVGEGPIPTKMDDKTSKLIIKKGREVGTTTGRVRSPGWLDLVLVNYAKEANGINSLAITKLDVLSGLSRIKLCVGYTQNGKKVEYPPHDGEFLKSVSPTYREFSGWKEDISGVREFKDLPKNARSYLGFIEEFTKIPIRFISVGPQRGQVIYPDSPPG